MSEALGFASPRHLLRALTSREIAEWGAFYQVKAEKQEDAAKQAEAERKALEIANRTARGGK